MGRVVPGGVRSVVMPGLKAGTSYDIKLYGSAGGQNTRALFDLATTGIFSRACLVHFVQDGVTEKPYSFPV